jgi:hypothetical protein
MLNKKTALEIRKLTKLEMAYVTAIWNNVEQTERDTLFAAFKVRLARYEVRERNSWERFHALVQTALQLAKNNSDCRALDALHQSLPKAMRIDFTRYVVKFGKVKWLQDGNRFGITGKYSKGEWMNVESLPPFRDFERTKKPAVARTEKSFEDLVKALIEKNAENPTAIKLNLALNSERLESDKVASLHTKIDLLNAENVKVGNRNRILHNDNVKMVEEKIALIAELEDIKAELAATKAALALASAPKKAKKAA